VPAPAKILASRRPGGAGQQPRVGRRGMELIEVKWGEGGSPLKRFMMVHGWEGGASMRGWRSAHRQGWRGQRGTPGCGGARGGRDEARKRPERSDHGGVPSGRGELSDSAQGRAMAGGWALEVRSWDAVVTLGHSRRRLSAAARRSRAAARRGVEQSGGK
jgi:hypothetical protein